MELSAQAGPDAAKDQQAADKMDRLRRLAELLEAEGLKPRLARDLAGRPRAMLI